MQNKKLILGNTPQHEFTLLKILKEDFFSINALLEQSGKKYVIKISRVSFLWVFGHPIASWLSLHEQAMYKRLQHIEGIPALHPVAGKFFLIHEYAEGSPLTKKSYLAENFFVELERIISEVHKSGVAYMDLSKRENIIVTPEGRPALIDFQLSMGVKPSHTYFHELFSHFVRRLQREDLYHIAKHKRSLRRKEMTEIDWDRYHNRSLLLRFHQKIRDPLLFLKRLVFPHGSHESRFSWQKKQ